MSRLEVAVGRLTLFHAHGGIVRYTEWPFMTLSTSVVSYAHTTVVAQVAEVTV